MILYVMSILSKAHMPLREHMILYIMSILSKARHQTLCSTKQVRFTWYKLGKQCYKPGWMPREPVICLAEAMHHAANEMGGFLGFKAYEIHKSSTNTVGSKYAKIFPWTEACG